MMTTAFAPTAEDLACDWFDLSARFVSFTRGPAATEGPDEEEFDDEDFEETDEDEDTDDEDEDAGSDDGDDEDSND